MERLINLSNILKNNIILDQQKRFWYNKNIIINNDEIKIMSYNMLSEDYMFEELYKNCNSKYLKWKYRKKLFIKEIKELKSDMILFQEVEKEKLIDIKTIMKKENYDFYYKKKEDRYKIKERKDGLGISINKKKFEMIKYYYINFNFESILLNNSYSKYDNIIKSLKNLNYNNISLFSIIKNKISNKKILIINCHLIFNRDKPQIKLLQLCIIYDIINKIKKDENIDYIIMGGDFNFIPNSMLYDMITKNKININVDPNEFSNQYLMLSLADSYFINNILESNLNFNSKNIILEKNEFKNNLIISIKLIRLIKYEINKDNNNEIIPYFSKNIKLVNDEIINYNENEINHYVNMTKKINLKSMYSDMNKKSDIKKLLQTDYKFLLNNNESNKYTLDSLITHFTIEFKATCDYLFLSKNIEVINTLNCPKLNYLKTLEVIPNKHIMSDHFSLVGIIKFN